MSGSVKYPIENITIEILVKEQYKKAPLNLRTKTVLPQSELICRCLRKNLLGFDMHGAAQLRETQISNALLLFDETQAPTLG